MRVKTFKFLLAVLKGFVLISQNLNIYAKAAEAGISVKVGGGNLPTLFFMTRHKILEWEFNC